MTHLGVLTLNVCLSVCPPIRFNGAPARAARVGDAIYTSIAPSQIDVICFQELVVQFQDVLKQLIYHKNHTHEIEGSLFSDNIHIVSSGLAIASRYKIDEEDAHVYTGQAYNAEAFMAKAIQYAKIILNEEQNDVLHIFNTHLQAWTSPKAGDIRRAQAREAASFIKRKLSLYKQGSQNPVLTQKHKVLFAGDLNVDFWENLQVLRTDLMDVLDFQLLMPQTPQFSFDPLKNSLVGSDDASEYATKSRLNGCYDEFVESGICTCCPRQLVDGIAVHQFCLPDLERFHVNVVPIEASTPFEIYINMSTTRTIQTISDHFGVFAELQFQKSNDVIIDLRFESHSQKNAYRKPYHLGWIFVEICIFFIIFIMLWKFLCFLQRKLT